jgi:ATP dependent DNA ligase domain
MKSFRVIARKNGNRVKLYSRLGDDLTPRFPLIVEALAKLRSRSCIIDGEAVACSEDGIACFDHIRYRRHDASPQHPRRIGHDGRSQGHSDLCLVTMAGDKGILTYGHTPSFSRREVSL